MNLDIFIYKTNGIKNPNIISTGHTKDNSHLLCWVVKYKYETLPCTHNTWEIFLYDNSEINPPMISGYTKIKIYIKVVDMTVMSSFISLILMIAK